MERINILGVFVDNLTTEEALRKAKKIIITGKPDYMAFLNVSQLVFCKENEQMFDFYRNAQTVLVDGTNITRLARFLHTSVKEKINGTVFLHNVCGMAADNGFSVFFFGGEQGGADKAVQKMKGTKPQLKIAGTYSPPYGFENDPDEMNKINEMLKKSNADILFVGLGSPKQDMFIRDNREIYQIPLSIPIGSGINYAGGVFKDCPKWISEIGLAWLYRCFQEPKRLFKRYFHVLYKIGKYYRQYRRENRNIKSPNEIVINRK